MSDLTGIILGRYHILEKLGEGGMATVYKAYDTRLERDVAVKFIRKDVFPPAQLDRILKRFEREAKALAKLSHPNIVNVLDYGEYEGSPFLVMVFLPSGTLKQILGKPIPWDEATNLLLPIARALQFAHKQGIIHRDIKPSNILITLSGEPILSDFGVAKILDSGDVASLTGTGLGIGTPEYMAPEQWTSQTTPQSDVYSLGVVFYEMITGRKPYIADTPAAILIKQNTEPLPSPKKYIPYIPEIVEKVLFKSMARDQKDRYLDMASFAKALESLLKEPSRNFEPVSQKRRNVTVEESSAERLLSPSDSTSRSTIIQENIPVPGDMNNGLPKGPTLERSETLAQDETRASYNNRSKEKRSLQKNWLWIAGLACLVVGGLLLCKAIFDVLPPQPLLTQVSLSIDNPSISKPSSNPALRSNSSTLLFTPTTKPIGIIDARRKSITSSNAAELTQLASYSSPSGYSFIAISPNGTTLAVINHNTDSTQIMYSFSLIDTSNGNILHTMLGHNRPFSRAVFSPDGSILATAAEDATILFWRVSDGVLLFTLASNKENDLAFSPDGSLLASVSGSVQIWRVSDGVPLIHLSTSFIKASSIAFSEDGSTLAASWDYSRNPVVLWGVPSYNQFRVLQGISGRNESHHLSFSPDGKNIAVQVVASDHASSWENIWQVSDGALLHTYPYSGVYSPNWSVIASTEGYLEIYNASDGTILKTLTICGAYHGGNVSFTQDSRLLAAGCEGGRVIIWGIP